MIQNLLFLLYTMATLSILVLAILLPFTFDSDWVTTWQIVTVYTLALIVAVTQHRVIRYFKDNGVLPS